MPRRSLAQKAGVDAAEVTNTPIGATIPPRNIPIFTTRRSAVAPLPTSLATKRGLRKRSIPAVRVAARPSSKRAVLPPQDRPRNAVVDTVRSLRRLIRPTSYQNSVAVCSDGSYGIEEGSICSFPVRTRGGKWETWSRVCR